MCKAIKIQLSNILCNGNILSSKKKLLDYLFQKNTKNFLPRSILGHHATHALNWHTESRCGHGVGSPGAQAPYESFREMPVFLLLGPVLVTAADVDA